MFPVLVIGDDRVVNRQLQTLLEGPEFGARVMVREEQPNREELRRMIEEFKPAMVFLSIDNIPRSLRDAAEVTWLDPTLPVLAAGRDCNPDTHSRILNAGIREFLVTPLHTPLFHAAIVRANRTGAATLQ